MSSAGRHMTRTRPTRGRGSGAEAPPVSRSTQHGKQRRLAAAGLAAATVAGGIIGLGAAAQAGTPPTGPGNIEIFNKRSMVALEGYRAQAGQEATVEVHPGYRGDRHRTGHGGRRPASSSSTTRAASAGSG